MTQSEYLKIKLDITARFLTVLLVAFFGVSSYLAINFDKNSALLNSLSVFAVIFLGLGVLFFGSGIVIILKKLGGLVK
ncbi:MAG: hypothetical protein LBP57_00045 [Endomicrobium sp.]|jgi:tellurite resistance protein TehA-like permease|nr:hypothetical protein [Endomicrobium sp.]